MSVCCVYISGTINLMVPVGITMPCRLETVYSKLLSSMCFVIEVSWLNSLLYFVDDIIHHSIFGILWCSSSCYLHNAIKFSTHDERVIKVINWFFFLFFSWIMSLCHDLNEDGIGRMFIVDTGCAELVSQSILNCHRFCYIATILHRCVALIC